MSWDAYVSHMMKNGSLSKAAIVGANDGAPWAVSPGFDLSASRQVKVTQEDLSEKMENVNERALVLEAVANGEMKSACGLFINGVKYMILTNNDEQQSLYIKAKNNLGGCITKTNQTILIGLFDTNANPTQNPGNCNKDVEELATKLRGANF